MTLSFRDHCHDRTRFHKKFPFAHTNQNAPVALQIDLIFQSILPSNSNITEMSGSNQVSFQTAFQPGGCAKLFQNLVKALNVYQPYLELPLGFPYNAAYGSAELKSWAESKSFRNWYKIPRYCKWMRDANDAFQTHVEFKGHTQAIIARMLDIILFETSPSVKESATVEKPMGLSNLGSVDGTEYKVGRVIDNNGFVVPSSSTASFGKITFNGGTGTFFMVPFEDTLHNSTERTLCFPVLILPKGADNDSGTGETFLYFTFQFPYKIFESQPAPSKSLYVLRTNQFHDLVPLITEIQTDLSIGANDKSQIFKGILDMLRTALVSTTMGALESRYNGIISNWISSKLIPPTPARLDVTTPTHLKYSEVQSNKPIDLTAMKSGFDLSSVVGQTPVYHWTPLNNINGYGLQIQVSNVYFGYDPKFNAANLPPVDTAPGWYSAPPSAELLEVNYAGVKGKPVHYASVSDFMQFSVDETSSTAVLSVTDRQFVLQRNESEQPLVYPMFLTRTMATLFRTVGIFWDPSKGMASNLTLGNLAMVSGMNTPVVQALILAFAESVSSSCIPAYGETSNVRPPFTYFSPLFTKEDKDGIRVDDPAIEKGPRETYYSSSIKDIVTYWKNAQSATFQARIGTNSIVLTDMGTGASAVRVMAPSGHATLVKPASTATDDNTWFMRPENAAAPAPSATDEVIDDIFGGGLSINMNVSQASDLKINLLAFSATANQHSVNGDFPRIYSDEANFSVPMVKDGPLGSNPYNVSRLAAVAGNRASPNGNANANANSQNNKLTPARAIVARTARAAAKKG